MKQIEEFVKSILPADYQWCALNEYGECRTSACYHNGQFIGCPLKRLSIAIAENEIAFVKYRQLLENILSVGGRRLAESGLTDEIRAILATKYEGYRMPEKQLQKYHLTTNGYDTLCGDNGMKIHRRYADRILDCGQWCKKCQEANHD